MGAAAAGCVAHGRRGPVPPRGREGALACDRRGESKALFPQDVEAGEKDVYRSHSCIHDEILHQRRRAGRKEYSVMPQVYHEPRDKAERARGRHLLSLSSWRPQKNVKKPIRIYLNYDAVGHSPDRECKSIGDIVKLGEPPVPSAPGSPICDPHGDPPVVGDCWYNCTLEDIAGEDKKQRLRKALGQTVEWFRKALAVEPVKGNLRLSGYSACGQDGGVQLPHAYVEDGVANADLVLLVTTRPTTGNTLAWAVACERDQWGRAIAGHVNVAPRHLTAEAETLLSATLIHEVMHVLGFDPHAFTHFRDERKRRRSQVTVQTLDEKLGRMVTRVVLPRVVMHSRHHYGVSCNNISVNFVKSYDSAFSQNFTGLELEDGGGRGTSGSHWEKRLLMNEIMTGSVDTRSVVSKMTLALLEDSGWYQANYSMAEHLDWGRNQGTEFVTSPCNSWKGAYRCNTTQLSGCTYNREAEGYCPIVSYSGDLPKWAQYFPQANKGGQSSLADYCTYYVAYSDGSCTDVNSARAPDRMLGEVRGSNSRCMASTLVRTGFVRGSMTQGNGCYQHRCTNNSLEVAVDGIWKSCPRSGGPVQFPGFNVLTVTALMVPATASLGFMIMIAAEGLAQISVVAMGCVKLMVSVTAKLDGQELTAQQVIEVVNYAGYTCQKGSSILPSLSMCHDVLVRDADGQHCAPSELSILQQLESVVLVPNYNRLMPSGRTFLNFFNNANCAAAAKRLACWISIQRCDEDGDNRLRVCYSACESYNTACGAGLECSDQTLFSKREEEEKGVPCTGYGEKKSFWL
ncbi:hypothetical protein PR202_ga13338 [Eleusine coracana subsp. coracana]|uniref:Leishmanolysin-like peptidase n=1 Tax=Eleusine coracana subsp. coracana TaxID=191504 RepID=A0AAV5CE13_ELECO|nr:hypothetical protein PR202_ga13338 [Eleusine coracana subsp. coracana]